MIKGVDSFLSGIPDVKKSDYAHIFILAIGLMQSIKNENIIQKLHPFIKSFIDNQDG